MTRIVAATLAVALPLAGLLAAVWSLLFLLLPYITRTSMLTVGDWRWAYRYRVAEGLPQAASYLRSRAQPGDLFAARGLSSSFVPADLPVQLVAMSGVPAYLSRPFMHIAYGGVRAQTALARLRALGIRWYVVAETDRRGPRWDPERRRAVFVDRMVAVYATQ
jgi:hypothetical protein